MLPPDTLDNLIETQRRAIRWYSALAAVVIVLGVAVLVSAVLWAGSLAAEPMKGLVGIGGAFISSISAYPIREVVMRQEKIGAFQSLKAMAAGSSGPEAERARELVWKAVEKTVLA